MISRQAELDRKNAERLKEMHEWEEKKIKEEFFKKQDELRKKEVERLQKEH